MRLDAQRLRRALENRDYDQHPAEAIPQGLWNPMGSSSSRYALTLIVLLLFVAGCPTARLTQESGYDDQARSLTSEEIRGRDTWFKYTGGNETISAFLAKRIPAFSEKAMELLDTRQRDTRFKRFGLINDPDCTEGPIKDPKGQFDLPLDKCADPESSGIVGIRKFANPNYSPAAWNPKDHRSEPPYLFGLACASCHAAFHPLHPPSDPEHPQWRNIHPTIGNQYLEEGKIFILKDMTDQDFRWHVLHNQPPGTSDTSRITDDHLDNPGTINAMFNLGDRPTFAEVMADGQTRTIHHVLKSGEDSIGLERASVRVFTNLGLCAEQCLIPHLEVFDRGNPHSTPFDMVQCGRDCPDWTKTLDLMADMVAFLKTQNVVYLKDAPGGSGYITKDQRVLDKGRLAFADQCARCHSSQKPAPGEDRRAFFLKQDFHDHDFLSNDVRYRVTEIETNACRALATNAASGHIWEQFSSKTYKALPSAGKLRLFNPENPREPLEFELPPGGPGYYRPASLISLWATAPFFHNNGLGAYRKDPSVRGRMIAFDDAVEKLLWPERRLKHLSIRRTSVDSKLPDGRNVPKGTPIAMVANMSPHDGKNLCPDYIEDKGHYYGEDLPDEDKRALIEFLKTL